MYNMYFFVFTGCLTIPINKTNMSTKCKDCCSEQQVNKHYDQSTVLKLIDTSDHISKAVAQDKSCCILSRNFSKAFNRVWHERLLFSLHT